MTMLRVGVCTDQGRTREHNEDAYLVLRGVLAVADGMGGHACGDVASRIAMETVEAFAPRLEELAAEVAGSGDAAPRSAMTEALEECFEQANRAVREAAVTRGVAAMGTTLVVGVHAGTSMFIAHVGDSRAYMCRNGRLEVLTEDHSVAMLRFRRGLITEPELASDPLRHKLYQAIGQLGPPDVDVLEVSLADGDRLMLCTDGLYDPVEDDRMTERLTGLDPSDGALQLIDDANGAGGPDNITVVTVHVDGGDKAEVVDSRVAVLRDLPLLADLTESERMEVARFFGEMRFEERERLVRLGEPADWCGVVVEGEATVHVGQLYLTKMTTGGHFGEFGLLEGNRRTADVTATTSMLLYTLSRSDFETMVRTRPEIGTRVLFRLLESTTNRLRELTDRINRAQRALKGAK